MYVLLALCLVGSWAGDILLYYIYITPFSKFCPAPFLFCYAFAQISFICSVCGRVVLFYLCSGTAPTFSAVEIDIGTYDCIVDLAAVLHDTALLIASYSLVTLVLVALGTFWWREIARAELTARLRGIYKEQRSDSC